MPSVLDLLILLFLVVVFGVDKLNIIEFVLILSIYIYTYISLFQICCCYHLKMNFFCLFSTILLLCIIAFDIFSNNYDILQIVFLINFMTNCFFLLVVLLTLGTIVLCLCHCCVVG